MVRLGKAPVYLGLGALLAVGATGVRSKQEADHEASTALYRIGWTKPTGWRELEHSPQSLFLFQDPKTGILLRGATTQMVADENPTPDLDSAGLAKYYLETTDSNMPEWEGKMIESEQGKGVPFSLIRRTREGKTVVSAFGVRGNTTLVMTLSAKGGEQRHMAEAEKEFRDCLRQISFTRDDRTFRRGTSMP